MRGRTAALGLAVLAVILTAGWFLLRGTAQPAPDEDPAGARGAAVPGEAEPPPGSAASGKGATLAGGPKPAPKTPAPAVVTGPRITGRVVDVAGKGIGGAHVLSLPDTNSATFLPSAAGKPGIPALDATAEAEGRFVLPVDKSAPYFAVFAEAEGFAPAVSAPAPAGGEVTVVLQRPASMAGTVTSAEGAPIAGARVRLLGFLDAVRVERETATDATGAYRLEGIPPRSRAGYAGYGVSACVEMVTAEGFAPLLQETSFYAFESGKTAKRDYVLTTGATLVGKVVDAESGSPFAGVRVALVSVEGMMGYGRGAGAASLSNPWSPRLLGETATAADGAFRFEHLPSQGRNRIASSSGGRRGLLLGQVAAWKEGTALATEEVSVPRDGETQEVVLKVSPAAVVVGRVLDAAGKPAKATVSAQAEGQRGGWFPGALVPDLPLSWATADEEGRYRISGVPAARAGPTKVKLSAYWITSSSGGDWNLVPKGEASLDVTAGATTTAPDLVVKVAGGAVVRATVRVLDPAGNPVWGATVGADRWAQNRTDADGRCTFPFTAAPAAPPNYVVRARGFAAGVASVMPTAEGAEVEVRLGAARRVSGVVLDAGRKPQPSALVTVVRGDVAVDDAVPPASSPFVMPNPKPGLPPLVVYATVTSGEDGAFVAEDLPDGPYNLLTTVSPKVGGMQAKPLRAVVAGVPTDATGVEVMLPLDDSPPTGGVEGSLVDAATGKPVTEFMVSLKRGTTTGGFATDRRNVGMAAQSVGSSPGPGRFTIPSLPAGTWTLDAAATGRAPVRVAGVEVVAGETRSLAPIAMGSGILVAGSARTADAVPLKGCTLWLAAIPGDGPDASGSAVLGADGAFKIGGLLPGRYRITCYGPDGSSDDNPPLVPADGEPYAIPAGATEVRLDPLLVVGGTLNVTPHDPRFPASSWDMAGRTSTDEERTFGEKTRLELRRADGRVVTEQKGVTRDWAGTLSWQVLVPGRYVLHVELPGDPPRDVPVTVEAGKTLRVVVPPPR